MNYLPKKKKHMFRPFMVLTLLPLFLHHWFAKWNSGSSSVSSLRTKPVDFLKNGSALRISRHKISYQAIMHSRTKQERPLAPLLQLSRSTVPSYSGLLSVLHVHQQKSNIFNQIPLPLHVYIYICCNQSHFSDPLPPSNPGS